jgi:hypothetical protein
MKLQEDMLEFSGAGDHMCNIQKRFCVGNVDCVDLNELVAMSGASSYNGRHAHGQLQVKLHSSII